MGSSHSRIQVARNPAPENLLPCQSSSFQDRYPGSVSWYLPLCCPISNMLPSVIGSTSKRFLKFPPTSSTPVPAPSPDSYSSVLTGWANSKLPSSPHVLQQDLSMDVNWTCLIPAKNTWGASSCIQNVTPPPHDKVKEGPGAAPCSPPNPLRERHPAAHRPPFPSSTAPHHFLPQELSSQCSLSLIALLLFSFFRSSLKSFPWGDLLNKS